MEEYCRFVLENQPLTARTKELRHRICRAAAAIDTEKLIAARDSARDVGRAMRVGDQMVRHQLRDSSVAAGKRLTEALRALAETAAVLDTQAAAAFEELRFDAYTLEKDIALCDNARRRFDHVRLYVLITAAPQDTDARILELARLCAEGGADCLQLRAKNIPDGRLLNLARSIVQTCADHHALSIINDRVDIAGAAGADGVHLGQDDLPLPEARRLQTKPLIFGLSTHNIDQLHAAIALNPAYIALGPAFQTATKPHEPCAGPQYIRPALKTLSGIPHVAIGGINLANLNEVLAWNVRTVAVCSAIANADNPKEQCQRFIQRLRAR